jgi:tetratricopeptide (TPR) repeat protein
VVWAPIVLLVLAAAGYGVKAWLDANEVKTRRELLFAEVDTALRTNDLTAVSQLTNLLQKLPDHDTARDVLAARARIELARGRTEKAAELFLAEATAPGASASDQAIGLTILLRLHEAGAGDRAAARGQLEQALTLGEAAAAELRSPAILLGMWQAAARLQDGERSKALAQRLQAEHADSPESGFVAFAVGFTAKAGVAAVDAAVAGLVPEPVEAQAMRVWAALDAGDVSQAVAFAEGALGRAPGVAVVRAAAAVVFHGCMLGCAAGSEDRSRWVGRRDVQIEWLLQRGEQGAARDQEWTAMRAQR